MSAEQYLNWVEQLACSGSHRLVYTGHCVRQPWLVLRQWLHVPIVLC